MKTSSKWSAESGFDGLSPGAQAIGRYADEHNGSLEGAFQEDPSLLSSLDEFHQWSAVTVAQIEGTNATPESGHSLKTKIVK